MLKIDLLTLRLCIWIGLIELSKCQTWKCKHLNRHSNATWHLININFCVIYQWNFSSSIDHCTTNFICQFSSARSAQDIIDSWWSCKRIAWSRQSIGQVIQIEIYLSNQWNNMLVWLTASQLHWQYVTHLLARDL